MNKRNGLTILFGVILFLGSFFVYENEKLKQGALLEEIDQLQEKIKELEVEVEDLEVEIEQIKYEEKEALVQTLSYVPDQEKGVSEIKDNENIVDRKWEAFVSATFRLETGNGTSNYWMNRNNAGGIKCGTEYCTYESKEEGYQDLERLLKIYVDEFGYDFKAIRAKYCQCGPEDYPKFMEIYNEEYNKLTE